MNNITFYMAIISFLICIIYSGFLSLFNRFDKQLGWIFGDDKKSLSGQWQAVLTSKIKQNLQGKFLGLMPLIIKILPIFLFYQSGFEIWQCFLIFFVQIFACSFFDTYLDYKVSIMFLLNIDYADIVNRCADYHKNGDEYREEACIEVIETLEKIISFFKYLDSKNLPLCVRRFEVWADFITYTLSINGENLIDRYNSCFMDEYELLYLDHGNTVIEDISNLMNSNTVMYYPERILKCYEILKISKEPFYDIRYYDDNFEEESLIRKADVIAKKNGYRNWNEYKKFFCKEYNIKRKKCDTLEKQLNYYSKKLGYDDFKDFYINELCGE